MKQSHIVKILTKHIQSQSYIDLNCSDCAKIQCIPISMLNGLLLLLRFFDFMPDGYEIIRIADIERVSQTDSNAFFEHVVKCEGAPRLISEVPAIPLDSWTTVFSALQALGHIITVDIGKEDCVNVGRVESVSQETMDMLCISPSGEWDTQAWTEVLTSITGVRFLDHYSRMFEKYSCDTDIWSCTQWKSFYLNCTPKHRTGAWLNFDKGIDPEVKKACKEFMVWLRRRCFFPIRVPIYIKSCTQLRARDGEMVSAACFLPWDRHVEPYIRVSAGDFDSLRGTQGQDNALAMILKSISHELTHYFQWINDTSLTEKAAEGQALTCSNRILDEYAQTRAHP